MQKKGKFLFPKKRMDISVLKNIESLNFSRLTHLTHMETSENVGDISLYIFIVEVLYLRMMNNHKACLMKRFVA